MKRNDVFTFIAPNGAQREAIVLDSTARFDSSFPDAAEVKYLCYVAAEKKLLSIKCMETDLEIYPSSKYMDDEYNPADGLVLSSSDIDVVANIGEYTARIWRYAENIAQMHFALQNWFNALKRGIGTEAIPNVTLGRANQRTLEEILDDMQNLLSKAIESNKHIKETVQ